MTKRIFLNKCLALLCAISVILSSAFVLGGVIDLNASASTGLNVWNGTVATEYAGGSGTEGDPYQIANGAQLALILQGGTNGKYYKLTDDIYLNDVSKVNWKTDNPNKWYTDRTFYGSLDGANHIIYGIYYDDNTTGWAGLFPLINLSSGTTCIIKNIGIKNSQIVGTRAGGFIGKIDTKNGVTVENCFVDETVSVKGVNAESGIISWISGHYNFIARNCYSKAILSGTASQGSGGLLGYLFLSDAQINTMASENKVIKFLDCYAITSGQVPVSYSSSVTKHILFNDSYGNIGNKDNLPGINILTTDKMQGAVAKDNMQYLDFDHVWQVGAEGKYPTLKCFPAVSTANVWDGTVATEYAGGSGTENDPYQIANGSQLALMLTAGATGTKGKFFKITEDIYLNDTTNIVWKTSNPNSWYSGKAFYGSLDGDYHTIYGIFYPETATDFAGLIPVLQPTDAGAVYVKNIAVKDSYIVGARAGGLIGKLNGSYGATVENCFVDETVSLKGTNAEGGIISWISGYYNILFKNCYSKATFGGNATQGKGGLLGYVYLDSNAKAAITNGAYIKFDSCYAITNTGPVTFSGSDGLLVLYPNCYGNVVGNANNNINILEKDKMQGAAAKENMIYFDFDHTWLVDEDGKYPTLRCFNATVSNIWNGLIADSFAGGTGTETDPYQITNGAELAYMLQDNSATVGKYYKLMNDIYLNDVSKEDWKTNSPNVWFKDKFFSGHLDGGYHTVYGVYYNENSTGWAALIPQITISEGEGKATSIKNIALKESHIVGEYAGAILGKPDGRGTKSLENCFADETVSVNGSKREGFIASIGHKNFSAINCYFAGSLSGNATQGSGGLAGYIVFSGYTNEEKGNLNVIFKNCYAITADGIAVVNDTAFDTILVSYPNCYGNVATTRPTNINILEKENMQGANAEIYMTYLDFEDTWVSGKSGKYPTLLAFESNSANADTYGGGSGTQSDPYLITNKDELERLRTASSATTKNKYFALANDIVINDTSSSDWKSTATNWDTEDATTFKGYLDGRGHTVSGLYIESQTLSFAGLFARLGKNAQVQNIGVINSYIKANNAGAIAGGISGQKVTVRKCFADENTHICGDEATGGLVGLVSQKYFTMANCYFTGRLSGKDSSNTGGLFGKVLSVSAGYTLSIAKSYVYMAANDNIIPQTEAAYASRFADVYSSIEPEIKLTNDVRPLIIDKEGFIGNNALTAMSGLDFDGVWTCVQGKTPVLRVFTAEGEPEITGTQGGVWSGKIANRFAGGTGTVSDPYIIKTAEQLAYLINTSVIEPMQTENNYYRLDADVKLNDTSIKNWYEKDGNNQWFNDYSYKSLGFRGYFDGNGHTVDGLYADGEYKEKCYGLFPSLGGGAVIEKVAVTNVYLNGGHRMGSVAGFVSMDSNTYDPDGDVDNRIKIRQCFAQSDVAIEGGTIGGILGHAARPVLMENCLSQVCPVAQHAQATLIGTCDSSKTSGPSEMRNCLVVHSSDKRTDTFWRSDTGAVPIVTNVYSAYATNGGTVYGMSTIWGDKAINTLQGFDFDNIWKTVETGTPVLRVFGTDSHSVEKQLVTISFYTYGGTDVESVSGYPGEKINWPDTSKISRDVDVFEGWYLEPEFLREFKAEVFPDYNAVLHAKWNEKTVRQDFEKYPYGFAGYDGLGLDYERYRPGIANYDMKYVHDGLASIHRIGKDATAGEQDFQIFQDDFAPLEIGWDYELSFWIYPESIKDIKQVLKLVHTDYLEVEYDEYALQKLCGFDKLKIGEWQEIKIQFTAHSYYLAIRTPAECSLYFDTFKIVPLGTKGKVEAEMYDLTKTVITEIKNDSDDTTNESEGKKTVIIKKYKKKKVNNQSSYTFDWWIIAVIVAAVVIITTVVTVIIVKKKRRNK